MIKKITFWFLICLSIFGLTSCNSCTMMAKNWESNNSFLLRNVKVHDSKTGEVFLNGEYEVYASTSDSKTGDFSLIINDNGRKVKYDFYGENLSLVMMEVR